MELRLQIISLLFSFIYGLIFYYYLELVNKINTKCNKVFKYIFSFLLIMFFALLYFVCLLYINNGYLHIYFLFSIMVGYILMAFCSNKWFTHKRK